MKETIRKIKLLTCKNFGHSFDKNERLLFRIKLNSMFPNGATIECKRCHHKFTYGGGPGKEYVFEGETEAVIFIANPKEANNAKS